MWRKLVLTLVLTGLLAVAAGAAHAATWAFRLEPISDAFQGQAHDVALTCYQYPQGQVSIVYLAVAYDLEELSFGGFEPADMSVACDLLDVHSSFSKVIDGPGGRRYGVATVTIRPGYTNPPPAGPCALTDGSNAPFTVGHFRFLATNDRSYQCDTVPLTFIWNDCGANSVWDSAYTVHMSMSIIDPLTGADIYAPAPEPSFTGASDSCMARIAPYGVNDVQFTNGWIELICPDTIDARADINCNGVKPEIADYVLLTQYLLQGPSVFTEWCSLQASDVNSDGLNGQIGDLMDLYRIVKGFCVLYQCSFGGVFPAVLDYAGGVLSIVGASPSMAHIVVNGQITPELLVADSGIEIVYAYDPDGDSTSILVMPDISLDVDSTTVPSFTGSIVDLKNAIIRSVNMVTSNGGIVAGSPTDVGSGDDPLPKAFALDNNYPNPFNPTTTIEYSVPTRAHVTVEIYNLLGQHVRTLIDEMKSEGNYKVEWNGTDVTGRVVSTGVYLYRFKAGDFVETKKMVLLK